MNNTILTNNLEEILSNISKAHSYLKIDDCYIKAIAELNCIIKKKLSIIEKTEEKSLLKKIKEFVSSVYQITEEAGEDIYSDLGKKEKIKIFDKFSSMFKKEIEEEEIKYDYDYHWCIVTIQFSNVSITLEGEVKDEELESLFIGLKYITVSINGSDILIDSNEKYNSIVSTIDNTLKNM